MKPAWLVGGIALAAFLIVRRKRIEPTLLAGGALGVVGALVYGAGLVEMPNLEKLIEDAGQFFGKWTYAVVPVLAFLETGAFVGLLTPGETFMVFGGVVAGQGRIDLVTLIGLTWTAAVLGDVASFYLGRRLGRQFLVRHGPKVQITEERLQQVDRFYDRHGGKAILLGRFVGLVRAVSPFLAGSGGMAFRRFIPYDIIGAGLWSTTFLVLGYVFWQRFGDVLNYAERGAFAFGTVIVVVVAGIWAYRWMKVEEHRHRLRVWIDEQLDRPALRPLAAVLRPLWRVTRAPRRFVWARITPGELGLEITTLMAVLSVSTYAVLAPLLALRDGRTPAGDPRSLELGDDIRRGWLNDVTEIVTGLGALPTVAAVVAVAAIVLALRGAAIHAFTLLVATSLTVLAVTLLKDAEDRPRPSGTLVDTSNAAFPSGHAAYAVAWVAVAVALTRVFPGFLRGTFLVLVSVVLVAIVGATRIYLRAHWLSDVTAGIGLGAGIFALCGMGALVVAHVRNNPRTPA